MPWTDSKLGFGIHILVTDAAAASTVAIETYVTCADTVRLKPIGQPKKVAQQILSRVGDAVALRNRPEAGVFPPLARG